MKTALFALAFAQLAIFPVQANAQMSPEIAAQAAQCVTRDCYMAVIKGGQAAYSR